MQKSNNNNLKFKNQSETMKRIDSIHNINRNEYFPNTVTYLNYHI